jgi:hypothetical protein
MIAQVTLRCSNQSCNTEHKVYFEQDRFSNFEYVCPKCERNNRFRGNVGTPYNVDIIPPEGVVAMRMT